jgi:hypothetical protein
MTKGTMSVFTERMGEEFDNEDVVREAIAPATPRHTRRLSDKILVAFHQACDTAELDVAEQLLGILEKMMSKRPTANEGNRRRNMESLVAAFERLWHLRHPER